MSKTAFLALAVALLPVSLAACTTDQGIGGPRVYTVTYRLSIDGTGTIAQLSINDGTGKMIVPENPAAPYKVTFPAAPGRRISATAGGTVTGTVELSVEARSTSIESIAHTESFTSQQDNEAFLLVIPVEFLP
jgi:hypothetical protein